MGRIITKANDRNLKIIDCILYLFFSYSSLLPKTVSSNSVMVHYLIEDIIRKKKTVFKHFVFIVCITLHSNKDEEESKIPNKKPNTFTVQNTG